MAQVNNRGQGKVSLPARFVTAWAWETWQLQLLLQYRLLFGSEASRAGGGDADDDAPKIDRARVGGKAERETRELDLHVIRKEGEGREREREPARDSKALNSPPRGTSPHLCLLQAASPTK